VAPDIGRRIEQRVGRAKDEDKDVKATISLGLNETNIIREGLIEMRGKKRPRMTAHAVGGIVIVVTAGA
jgi:hypothetical protein